MNIDFGQVHGRPIFVGEDCIGVSTASGDVAVGDVDRSVSLDTNGSIEVCE